MQKLPIAVLATATALGLPALAHAAPGQLDPAYGLDGSAAAFGSPIPFAVDALPDGTTLTSGVASFSQQGPNGGLQYGLVEHSATGRLVRSYGVNSLATVEVGSSNNGVQGSLSAVTRDGRAYVVGLPTSQNAPQSITVQRLTAAGGPDPTYGVGGTATVLYPNSVPQPTGVAVAADGSAYVIVAHDAAFDVVRLRPNGAVDPTYGTAGFATVTPDPVNNTTPAGFSPPRLLADGSLVLTFVLDPTGNGGTTRVAKLTPGGKLDTGWGTAGLVDTGLPSSGQGLGLLSAPVPLSGGRLALLSPSSGTTPSAAVVPSVVALTAKGARDATFGTAGLARLAPPPAGTAGVPLGLDVQPNGSVLVTEAVTDGTFSQVDGTVRRLRADGKVDATFGDAGAADLGNVLPTAVRYVPATGRAIVSSVAISGGGPGAPDLRGFVADVPPTARIAGPTTATAGTPVRFDASGSTDADGRVAAYAWDLDGDGQFDDATGAAASTTLPGPGRRTVRVRVTDDQGLPAIASATVTVPQPSAGTTSEQPPATTTITTTAPAPPPVTVQVPVPVPAPGTTGTTPTATAPAAGTRPTLRSTTLTLDAKGHVALRLRCAAGTATCSGTVSLRLGTKAIGTASYSVAAGKTATVRLTVKRAQRTKALKRGAKLTVRIAPTGGTAATKAVTLKRARR